MSIYRIGDTFGIDYRDEYGRRHRKPVGSREAAIAIEARLKEEVARAKQSVNRFALGEGLTLEAARDIWLSTLPVGKPRREHITRTLGTLAAKLGNQAAAQITPKLLVEYAAIRAATLAPSTQANENGTLRQFFGWLAEQGYLPSNPAADLPTQQSRRSTGISISYNEELKILDACRTASTRLKILLALDGGLRISEILSLRREHWNRDENTLTVFSTKNRTTRLIPLSARATAQLRELGHLMPNQPLTAATKTSQPSSNATSFLRKSKTLPTHVRFHDLRHSFASRVAAVSKPHVVRTLLGHKPQSTTDLYLHPSMDELREAIAAMQAANPNCKLWPRPPLPAPAQPEKEKETKPMPGKRFTLTITDPMYGYLCSYRFRPSQDQTSAQPGTILVESADLEGRFVVSLIHLQQIVQPSTFKKEDEKPQ